MAIENIIHDLRVYFDSLQKPVEFRPQMAGMFNPSYLTVRYKDQEQVLTFWSVASKSEAEKRLAVAFRDDIEAFIQRVDHAPAIESNQLQPDRSFAAQLGEGDKPNRRSGSQRKAVGGV